MRTSVYIIKLFIIFTNKNNVYAFEFPISKPEDRSKLAVYSISFRTKQVILIFKIEINCGEKEKEEKRQSQITTKY